MEWLSDPNAWIALVTLTLLGIVLGIDNVIFISILAGKLFRRADQRARAQDRPDGQAMVMRILLLMSIAWIIRLTAAAVLESAAIHFLRARLDPAIDSGLFLIFPRVDARRFTRSSKGGRAASAPGVAPSARGRRSGQIMLLDIVFSLDRSITAVGMADDLAVMIAAVVIAVGIMMVSSGGSAALSTPIPRSRCSRSAS